jgi:hypothetical protein
MQLTDARASEASRSNSSLSNFGAVANATLCRRGATGFTVTRQRVAVKRIESWRTQLKM